MKTNGFRFFSAKDYAILREELKVDHSNKPEKSIEKTCHERLLSILPAIDELDMDKQVIITIDVEIRPKSNYNISQAKR